MRPAQQSRARHPAGRQLRHRHEFEPPTSAAAIVNAPGFRVGTCDCGVWLQGGDQAWADHRRIVHGEGG